MHYSHGHTLVISYAHILSHFQQILNGLYSSRAWWITLSTDSSENNLKHYVNTEGGHFNNYSFSDVACL